MALPSPHPNVAEQTVDDGLLLLLDDGSYIVINRTGLVIWTHLAEAKDEEDLARRVCDTLDLPVNDTIRKDISKFLRHLEEKHFLVESQ